ncbi:MAG TPA: aminotransferase class I/II-fold pyridoxal phosphate-dependent enzyme [Acidimicrobiia bacterium]|nr:aminotransferase class I/II-fold pyridoxal phosphate-dependent enzyme [Acidimicrobiia bacterium]
MSDDAAPGGFVPPIYPYFRLDALKQKAAEAPGGIVDLSVGTPNDPVPDIVIAALAEAGPGAAGYPRAIGGPALREAAAGWMERSFGVTLDPAQVVSVIGTKELVASLPHLLRLRDPSRDTVLYPAVSYPTYAMGAELGGCRAVPVPLGDGWHVDLSAVSEEDAARTLLLWVNEPGNPTGSQSAAGPLGDAVAWAQARGIVVASDECYVEFNWDEAGEFVPGATALQAGIDGVLAVHSLSKRSNMAGYRCGFVAGDGDLVAYIASVRTHAGMMVPGPIQAAATVAWADDAHVVVQRDRYAERRNYARSRLAEAGLVDAGGPSSFYLWLRSADPDEDGWALTARLAETGTLVAAGDLYGEGGGDCARMALVQPLERLELAFDRMSNSMTPTARGMGGVPPTEAAGAAKGATKS